MTTHFGPVTVADKRLVDSGKLYSITLQQLEAHTDYTLTDNCQGLSTKSPPTTYRRVKIRVLPEEADKFTLGATVPGHIGRTIHGTPQHKGHQPAYTGGYHEAIYYPAYQDDTDLR